MAKLFFFFFVELFVVGFFLFYFQHVSGACVTLSGGCFYFAYRLFCFLLFPVSFPGLNGPHT